MNRKSLIQVLGTLLVVAALAAPANAEGETLHYHTGWSPHQLGRTASDLSRGLPFGRWSNQAPAQSAVEPDPIADGVPAASSPAPAAPSNAREPNWNGFLRCLKSSDKPLRGLFRLELTGASDPDSLTLGEIFRQLTDPARSRLPQDDAAGTPNGTGMICGAHLGSTALTSGGWAEDLMMIRALLSAREANGEALKNLFIALVAARSGATGFDRLWKVIWADLAVRAAWSPAPLPTWTELRERIGGAAGITEILPAHENAFTISSKPTAARLEAFDAGLSFGRSVWARLHPGEVTP